MTQEPSRKPEWEHWPGRRHPDHPLRDRLRALFTPTDQGDQIEELVAARGRELELRVGQLAEAVADVERREEQVRRLRIAVEEMLRHGSAELDDRHAELAELAGELREREARLAELERDVDERRRELGAVELHRAAVERREAAAAERDAAFEGAAAALRERENAVLTAEQRVEALLERQAGLEANEAALVEQAARLEAREGALSTDAARVEKLARQLEAREREQSSRAAAADAELTARDESLDRRRIELDEREHALAQRLAEVEASRLSLALATEELGERERRFADLEAREQALEDRADRLRAHEDELHRERRSVLGGRQELARAVAAVASDLGLASTAPPPVEPTEHLLFVPGDRYRLLPVDDRPTPEPGDTVTVDDRVHVVVRVTSSPLPGDERRCAILEAASVEAEHDTSPDDVDDLSA